MDKKTFQSNLFEIKTDADFNRAALSLFQYQIQNNLVYGNYVKALGINYKEVNHYTCIPHLPISFFKQHFIQTIYKEKYSDAIEFISSGTTEQVRSKHAMASLSWYEKVCEHSFEYFFGDLSHYVIVAFLPSYIENKQSSLLYMVNHFIKKSNSSLSNYYDLHKHSLQDIVDQAKSVNKKVWVIGVTYALLDLIESQSPLKSTSNLIIVETGGMKGRRKDIVRTELHALLKSGLGINQVYSEYGMCELTSQAYSMKDEVFETLPWVKLSLREINDPFTQVKQGNGVIQVIDLANLDSCAFIETQDIGFKDFEGRIKVLGRLDHSEQRGCNLMYQN